MKYSFSLSKYLHMGAFTDKSGKWDLHLKQGKHLNSHNQFMGLFSEMPIHTKYSSYERLARKTHSLLRKQIKCILCDIPVCVHRLAGCHPGCKRYWNSGKYACRKNTGKTRIFPRKCFPAEIWFWRHFQGDWNKKPSKSIITRHNSRVCLLLRVLLSGASNISELRARKFR